ncbi:hypothetical protein A2480_04120 [Candidatus Uhrbacteria bacterium RIFOXYC2_FULL_47_19]|uniref:Uncharacterized protein n=1 Tax=Candidatus Uhrbacteria bacterium RIFOXYC2_FULL_47_19 TaxID=1802424 RepID=A0A1F7WCA5_9BACT|nr:MAG: hypothetical protein A2480_04120 [Candidatus Uhrbacteria bacterium RIFOXYC2_FULL_47_19]HCC21795.1 hypothetical protein [Candidatus Uhrbacteria bacterium]
MSKARLLLLIPVVVLGLIIGIFTLLTSARLFFYLLDDKLTFINDTDERIVLLKNLVPCLASQLSECS